MIRTPHHRERLVLGALACALLLACPAGAQQSVPADTTAAAAIDSAAVRRAAAALFDPPPRDTWDSGVSATGAVLMTPVFPGWGQLYADNSWRAALAYGAQMYFWTNIISKDRQARRSRDFAGTFAADNINRGRYDAIAVEQWEQMRDFAWWSGGVLLIVALDAYVGAHLFDFDRDPVPVPDRWDQQFGPPGGDLPGGVGAPSITVFQWRKTF